MASAGQLGADYVSRGLSGRIPIEHEHHSLESFYQHSFLFGRQRRSHQTHYAREPGLMNSHAIEVALDQDYRPATRGHGTLQIEKLPCFPETKGSLYLGGLPSTARPA